MGNESMLNSGLNLETVEKISKQREEPYWIRDKRIKALKAFQESKLPETDRMSNIALVDFGSIEIEENNSEIFASSDNKIAFEDLSIALRKYPELIKEKLMSACVNAFESKFTALHYAFWSEGAFLYIPKGVDAGTINLVTKMGQKSKFENILIIAEERAKAAIIEKSISENMPGYRSQIVELFLGEEAEITYASVQELSRKITNVSIKRAVLGRNASMKWVDCSAGGSFTISEVSTIHAGRGANSKTLSTFFGGESQRFELSVNSFHKAQDTESRMVARGMLKDRAKSVYYGLIDIDENGAGTTGYQREDALLLGGNAEANAIPKLQIRNNDVRCSHGTAIGQLDEEKIFYLMSRGLSGEEARQIVVEGFFEPLLREITEGEIKESIREIIMRKNRWES